MLSSTGTNNANFMDSDPLNLLTPVGTYAGSHGPYDTYDQGGNVQQWTETAYEGGTHSAVHLSRILPGR